MNLPAVYAAGSMSVIPGKICRVTGAKEPLTGKGACGVPATDPLTADSKELNSKELNSKGQIRKARFERPDLKDQIRKARFERPDLKDRIRKY
jgi:hypothetical protein